MRASYDLDKGVVSLIKNRKKENNINSPANNTKGRASYHKERVNIPFIIKIKKEVSQRVD